MLLLHCASEGKSRKEGRRGDKQRREEGVPLVLLWKIQRANTLVVLAIPLLIEEALVNAVTNTKDVNVSVMYSPCNMKLEKQYCDTCDTKNLFA